VTETYAELREQIRSTLSGWSAGVASEGAGLVDAVLAVVTPELERLRHQRDENGERATEEFAARQEALADLAVAENTVDYTFSALAERLEDSGLERPENLADALDRTKWALDTLAWLHAEAVWGRATNAALVRELSAEITSMEAARDHLAAQLNKAHTLIGEMKLREMGIEPAVSESVPTTPEPPLEVGDRVEFSSLQPEWRDGTVAGISPLRVRADDTDNLTTNPAAVRRLPSGVDLPEVEAGSTGPHWVKVGLYLNGGNYIGMCTEPGCTDGTFGTREKVEAWAEQHLAEAEAEARARAEAFDDVPHGDCTDPPGLCCSDAGCPEHGNDGYGDDEDDSELPEEFLALAREAHAEIEGHLAENPVPSPAASADTTPLREDECGALEGMTGIECDRYPGHQDWHSGKHTPRTDGTELVGYPVHIQWPRMNYDRCAPASSTFREGDREPQPDVRFVRGSRSGRTYERRSDGYGGHWDYRNGDGISWRVWEALLREERSVEVLPNAEQEAGR
jgi:hypothetical protein